MADPILSAECVSVGYDGVDVVSDVSLTVSRGEIVAFVGANGAGKSTLIKSFAGLIRPSSGKVSLNGGAVTVFSVREFLSRGVGYMPQGAPLFGDLTIGENLTVAAHAVTPQRRSTGATLARKVAPDLDRWWRRRAMTLSGGEAVLIALANAVASAPNLLLLDEPTAGLDTSRSEVVLRALSALAREEGIACVVVEQNVRQVLTIADRVHVLRLGRIVYEGHVVPGDTPPDLARYFF